MENNEKLDRIRKLLKLAANNPNPNEAAVAFGAAQELATRIGLDLDSVDVHENPPPPIGEVSHRTLEKSQNRILWKLHIAEAVARANGCKTYTSGGSIVAYGQYSDLDIVEVMFHAICTQVEAMARRAIDAYKSDPDLDPRFDPSPRMYLRDWRIGCGHQISRRLVPRDEYIEKKRQELQATQDQTTQVQALVRIQRREEQIAEANESYAKSLGLRPTAGLKGARNRGAYESGRAAGNTVSLKANRALKS